MATKSNVQNQVKGHNPQKAHLHPQRDVCMQYENNPVSVSENRLETEHIQAPLIKVNHGLKIKAKTLIQ